jgi:hypothetical protein
MFDCMKKVKDERSQASCQFYFLIETPLSANLFNLNRSRELLFWAETQVL